MDLANIQPILNESALLIKDKKILIIADLHIGIEAELKEQGINAESQTHKMTERIKKICKKYKIKEIILLGDIKHNIPFSTNLEIKDVQNFLKEVQKLGIIHIIPGNHDGNIDRLTPEKMNIYSSEGFIIDNIGFIHGHRWPSTDLMNCDQIIIGHTHPTIMLTDRLEYKTFEPCWIKGKILKEKLIEKYPNSKNPEILVIPAFNPLCGGIAANKDGINGPVGKIIDINNSQIFLLDGTSLGKVINITYYK